MNALVITPSGVARRRPRPLPLSPPEQDPANWAGRPSLGAATMASQILDTHDGRARGRPPSRYGPPEYGATSQSPRAAPGDEVFIYLLIGVSVLGTWLLAFRPRVTLTSDGRVTVRNPIKTSTFHAGDVVAVEPNRYGVVFVLRDGRRPWTVTFQDTFALSGEPRWFDLAEAVTGERPKYEYEEEEEEEWWW